MAFQSMGKKITFQELDIQSSKFASFLQKSVKLKGDRVALMMPNTLEFVIASIGIFRAGATLVPLNPLYTKNELRKVLFEGVDGKGKGATMPSLIISLNKFAENIQGFIKEGKVKKVVLSNIGDSIGGLKGSLINLAFKYLKKEVPPHSIKNYIPFLDYLNYDTNFKKPELNLKDRAVLQFTGGTSGTIKAATLNHGNLLSNITQNLDLIKLSNGDGRHWEPGDTFLGILPLFHIFALNVCFLSSIGLGYGVVLIPNPKDLDSILKTWSKNKINFIAGVNTLFQKLLEHKNFNKDFINFDNLKAICTGGMAIQEKVHRELQGLVK